MPVESYDAYLERVSINDRPLILQLLDRHVALYFPENDGRKPEEVLMSADQKHPQPETEKEPHEHETDPSKPQQDPKKQQPGQPTDPSKQQQYGGGQSGQSGGSYPPGKF